MASYKTHISAGIVLGLASVAAATTYSLVSDDLLLALVFLFALIGSVLPDLDSDEGKPLRILLHVVALLSAMVAFLYIKQDSPGDTITQLFSLMFVYAVVRYGVGEILKRFTHHRGIFHSLPAMLLSFLGTLLLLERFDLGALEKLAVAGSLALGFLGHLVLDEVKSATSLSGLRLKPSRSFGTALKLWSNSKVATISVYALVLVTGYMNLTLLNYYVGFFEKLISQYRS